MDVRFATTDQKVRGSDTFVRAHETPDQSHTFWVPCRVIGVPSPVLIPTLIPTVAKRLPSPRGDPPHLLWACKGARRSPSIGIKTGKGDLERRHQRLVHGLTQRQKEESAAKLEVRNMTKTGDASVSALETAAMRSIRSGQLLRGWGQLIGILGVVGGVILIVVGFGGGVPAVVGIGLSNLLIAALLYSAATAFGWHIELSGQKGILLADQDRESLSRDED